MEQEGQQADGQQGLDRYELLGYLGEAVLITIQLQLLVALVKTRAFTHRTPSVGEVLP